MPCAYVCVPQPCGLCIMPAPPRACCCEPFVADCKNPPSVCRAACRRPCRPVCGVGIAPPRGVAGPPGCGAVGVAPCGPAGAPRDRGPMPREPVCVPSHATGPDPTWLAVDPNAGPPVPCGAEADVICQPPCDVICMATCARCGCIKPCPCEKRAQQMGRGGKCGMGAKARPGVPCPSRAKGRRPCAAPCGEICRTRGSPAASKEGRGTYIMQLPCPCCKGMMGPATAGVVGDTLEGLVDKAMDRAEAEGAVGAALAGALGTAEAVGGVLGDLGGPGGQQGSANEIVSAVIEDVVQKAIPD